MIAPKDVVASAIALPAGTSQGRLGTARWIANKSSFAQGRAIKVVAEEVGSTGYVSLNLYLLHTGARLYPCEMPAERVIDFLRRFAPDPAGV